MRTLFLAVLLTTAAPAFAQSASLVAAHAKIAADYDKTVAEVIELTEIPAPPFKETARAQRVIEDVPTEVVRPSEVAGNGPPWTVA